MRKTIESQEACSGRAGQGIGLLQTATVSRTLPTPPTAIPDPFAALTGLGHGSYRGEEVDFGPGQDRFDGLARQFAEHQ